MIFKCEKVIFILNKDKNLLWIGKDVKLLVIKDDIVRFNNRLI